MDNMELEEPPKTPDPQPAEKTNDDVSAAQMTGCVIVGFIFLCPCGWLILLILIFGSIFVGVSNKISGKAPIDIKGSFEKIGWPKTSAEVLPFITAKWDELKNHFEKKTDK